MSENNKIRIDKWLWAARFFKTREQAKTAVTGGKVHCNHARIKAAYTVKINDILEIQQGFDKKTVVVKALSDKRGPYEEAKKLCIETDESIALREEKAKERKAKAAPRSDKRPDKRNRKLIRRFRQKDP